MKPLYPKSADREIQQMRRLRQQATTCIAFAKLVLYEAGETMEKRSEGNEMTTKKMVALRSYTRRKHLRSQVLSEAEARAQDPKKMFSGNSKILSRRRQTSLRRTPRKQSSPILYKPSHTLETKKDMYNGQRDPEFKATVNTTFCELIAARSTLFTRDILILDGPEGGTTQALQKVGVNPRRITIPNYTPSTCQSLRSKFHVNIFEGSALNYLLSTKKMFHHVYFDACGRLDSKDMLKTLTRLFEHHLAGISMSLSKRDPTASVYFEGTFFIGRGKTEIVQLRNKMAKKRSEKDLDSEVISLSCELTKHANHCNLIPVVLFGRRSGLMVSIILRLTAWI